MLSGLNGNTLHFLVSTITLLALLSPEISVRSVPTVDEATEFSLIYGYPLLPFTQWAVPIVSSHDGTNSLKHNRKLSTAADQFVVRPNVDTLYSHAVFDLSANDLIIEVPPIKDRYWVFPLYDAYGNNCANLGSTNNNNPGKYHIRYANSAIQKPGVHLCSQRSNNDCLHNPGDRLQGFINSPTAYAGFVGRILVKNKDSDIQHIHAVQNETKTYPISRRDPHPDYKIPKLTTAFLNGSLSSDIPTKIMQLTARLAPFNPARNITDHLRVERMLRTAGIHEGQYTPTTRNLTRVAQETQADVKAYATKPGNMVNLKNNWNALSPSGQGDYNKDYKMRSYVAYKGYLAVVATEALYPSYGNSGTLDLGSKQAYTVTFDSKPPQLDVGFWSLTAYNAEQFLVPNPLNRYVLGDRSSLTYADGAPVYDSGSKNASFQILVQPANVQPPKNWTTNWLPAPVNGGPFSINLRFFGPDDALMDGQWVYPVMDRHDAIAE